MKKILIVEDEKPLAEEFAEWLQFEDYEVIMAYDGKQGLDMALAELNSFGYHDAQAFGNPVAICTSFAGSKQNDPFCLFNCPF